MNKKLIILIIAILGNSINLAQINLKEAKKIGNLIWQNEASKRVDLLTFWSPHESFPSFGIGHCIWIPAEQHVSYAQEFPLLCKYLQKKGVKLPKWLQSDLKKGAPWPSREDFLADSTKIKNLQNLLINTIDLQIEFMIYRLEKQWPLILKSAPLKDRSKVSKNFKLMLGSALGTYALIDYLNFKGSGINLKESRNGHRWGLLQVLLNMPDNLNNNNVCKAFCASAANILALLICNSGPEYNNIKFLRGWMNRIATYSDVSLFEKS